VSLAPRTWHKYAPTLVLGGLILGGVLVGGLWSVDRRVLVGTEAPGWLSLLTVFSAVVTTGATSLYPYATWQLLVETRTANAENRQLSRHLHQDTLAPYVCLNGIRADLYVTSRKNESLRVHAADLVEGRGDVVIVNSLGEYSVDELGLKGSVDFALGNTSDNTADARVHVNGVFGELSRKIIIGPKGTESVQFRIDGSIPDTRALMSLLDQNEEATVSVSSKGPGISATDHFEASWVLGVGAGEGQVVASVSGAFAYTRRYRRYEASEEQHV